MAGLVGSRRRISQTRLDMICALVSSTAPPVSVLVWILHSHDDNVMLADSDSWSHLESESMRLKSCVKWAGWSRSSIGILSRPGKGGSSPRRSPRPLTASHRLKLKTPAEHIEPTYP